MVSDREGGFVGEELDISLEGRIWQDEANPNINPKVIIVRFRP